MIEYTEETIRNISRAAVLRSEVQVPHIATGCGRVYLCFGKIRTGSKLAKLIEATVGARFVSRPYHSYKCLYFGYDNASGNVYREAQRWAEAFRLAGLPLVYADGDDD